MPAEIVNFSRFSRSEYETIKRHFNEAIAKRFVSEILWSKEEGHDEILVIDADGYLVWVIGKDPYVGSFCALNGRSGEWELAKGLDELLAKIE